MNPLVRRLGFTALLVLLFILFGHWLNPPTPPSPSPRSHAPLLNPLVQVRLMALSNSGSIPLQIEGHWLVKDGSDPQHPVLLQRSGSFHGELRTSPTGPQLGPYQSNRDHIVIEPEGDEALRIGTYLYPGTLHVRMERDKAGAAQALHLSLELPLEDYVLGVVCGEMPSQAPGAQAALRAQAVAARTYALNQRNRDRLLRDDTFDQVFRGLDFHTHQAEEAVAATRSLVLTWQEQLVPAFFHRNCGGATANAANAGFVKDAIPPLSGVQEPACRSPRNIWQRQVSAEQLDALAKRYQLGSWLRAISTVRRDPSGRLLEVRLIGEKEERDLSAEQYRAALHLPSTQLVEVLVQEDGSAIFRGRGYGHGVGMCQEGALRLARQGASYEEILAHYYPQANLVPLTSHLSSLLPPRP